MGNDSYFSNIFLLLAAQRHVRVPLEGAQRIRPGPRGGGLI